MGSIRRSQWGESVKPPGAHPYQPWSEKVERGVVGEGCCGRGVLWERGIVGKGIVGEAYRGHGLTWRDSTWWPCRMEGDHQTPCPVSAPTLQLRVSTSHWLKPTGSQRTREPLMWSTKANLLVDRVKKKVTRKSGEWGRRG